jgi:hypothetical protein
MGGGGGSDASADAGARDSASGVDGDVRDGDARGADADARSNDVSTDPSADTVPVPDAQPDNGSPKDAVSEPYCGDGHKDAGEECDQGSANLPNPYGPGLCSTQCTNAPYCGDGTKDPQEQCDQGPSNQPNPYGQGLCSTQCTNAPYCGDGTKDPQEQCDQGASNQPNPYGQGLCSTQCTNAPYCGDGTKDAQEQCDLGSANQPTPYGQGTCSTQCKNGGYCGDGATNGPEACDNGGTGSTDLGACNPVCTGYYEKKIIKPTIGFYSTDLGGPSGADAICQAEFGSAWKAFLVGGSRRATVTPLAGDGQQDWVIQKYTHYYNTRDEFIWRTDDLALLGVRNGMRLTTYANPFDAVGSYPWTGWESDWTTVAEDPNIPRGTCLGWTSTDPAWRASFCLPDLTHGATELCGGTSFILCVQQ